MTSEMSLPLKLLNNGDKTENASFSAADFRARVIGGWDQVYPPVRERMDRLLTSSEPVIFEGEGCVRCSWAGWAFAQISVFLGGPLVRKTGNKTKTVVKVIPGQNGIRCWHRSFFFRDGTVQIVQTSKVIDNKLGFIDAVGALGEKHLATKMRVWSSEKSLFFESTMYILRFKHFNIRIPSVLTPGILFAEHRDLGNGYFRYILKFTHPILGETFYQDGIFTETKIISVQKYGRYE